MPTFKVTDPQSGQTLSLTGDSPPTEVELTDIFSQMARGESPSAGVPPQDEQVTSQQVVEPALQDVDETPEEKSLLDRIGEDAAEGLTKQFIEKLAFGLSAREGLKTVLRGVGTLAAKATGKEELLGKLTENGEKAKRTQAGLEKLAPIPAQVGQILGESLAIPGFGIGRTALQRGASAIAGGGAAGAVFAAGKGDDIISGTLTGLGFGAGFQGLSVVGKKIARRILNANQGVFTSKNAQEVIEAGKREGVDVFAEDVSSSGLIKRLSTISEDVPFSGTIKARIKQAQQQENAAESLRRSVSKDVDDFVEEAQVGLQKRLAVIKQRTSKLFAKAADKLDPLGPIPTSKFDDEINNQIQLELAKRRPDQALIKELESFKGDPGDFTFTRELLTELNDEISQFFKGGREAIGEKGARPFLSAKRALEDDLEAFVKDSGSEEGLKAFQTAKKFFIARQAPFINTRLAKLVKTDEPEKIAQFILSKNIGAKKGIKSRAQILFKSLDQKGREAVKVAIIDHAFTKALSPEGRLSAQKFANALDEFEAVRDVFIKGPDKTRINGLIKLFRATSRATQIAENQPTGRRVIPLATVSAIGIGVGSGRIGTTIAILGGINIATRTLLRNETGRKLLTGLNRTTEGTKAFEASLEKISQFLARATTSKATRESQ